jgi:hypothetical protein
MTHIEQHLLTMSGDGQRREIFRLFPFWGGGWDLLSVPQSLGHVQNAHSAELFPLSILYAFVSVGACVMPNMLCTKA